jgi:hypothetical protein
VSPAERRWSGLAHRITVPEAEPFATDPTHWTGYDPTCSLSGAFEVEQALAANLNNFAFTPIAFSFTDANITLSNTNANPTFTQFCVSASSTGTIEQWGISLPDASVPNKFFISDRERLPISTLKFNWRTEPSRCLRLCRYRPPRDRRSSLEATGYTTRVLRGGWDVIFQVAAGLRTLDAGSDKGPRVASTILLALGLTRIGTADIETLVVRAKKIRINLHWRKDSVRNGRRSRRLLPA